MHVKKLTVQNVKSFRGEHVFRLTSGLNYLVGDNNCGKSSIFEAFMYLAGGRVKEEDFFTRGASEPTRVEVVLAGDDIRDLVADEKFKKYHDYLHADEDGDEVLRVERNTADREVVQGSGKPVKLDGKKACFWHNGRKQFENPTGIDALFKALIDFEPVWADTDPTEFADFSSTKTLGRLVDSAAAQFFDTDEWGDFTTAHKKAFASKDRDSLEARTTALASEMEVLVRQQYGPAAVRFEFELPDASAFVKMGTLLVDDGAGETPLGGKGTGMQRAFALAIIQLYAKSTSATSGPTKPLVLLIDEPETWLHPTAQLRLADALSAIARTQQLFLITHSPYLLRRFDAKSHQMIVFKDKGSDREFTYSRNMGVLGTGEPTWGEINYHAFGISSHEFHNELYGDIQRHLEVLANVDSATEKDIDEYLVQNGILRSKIWTRSGKKAPHSVTLAVYVRNSIHHPENKLNLAPTDLELAQSTADLLTVLNVQLNKASAQHPSEEDAVA